MRAGPVLCLVLAFLAVDLTEALPTPASGPAAAEDRDDLDDDAVVARPVRPCERPSTPGRFQRRDAAPVTDRSDPASRRPSPLRVARQGRWSSGRRPIAPAAEPASPAEDH